MIGNALLENLDAEHDLLAVLASYWAPKATGWVAGPAPRIIPGWPP